MLMMKEEEEIDDVLGGWEVCLIARFFVLRNQVT
jgi:hypothetical protein